MLTKVCRGCKQEKPLSDFYEDARSTGPVGKGRTTYCKQCEKSRAISWRMSNLQRYEKYQRTYDANRTPQERRRRHLVYTRHITPEQYDAMLAAQGGHCAICPATEPGRKRKYFCVDHDHETKEIRGLLCGSCNSGLGYFKDRPTFLRAAADYLESYGRT